MTEMTNILIWDLSLEKNWLNYFLTIRSFGVSTRCPGNNKLNSWIFLILINFVQFHSNRQLQVNPLKNERFTLSYRKQNNFSGV